MNSMIQLCDSNNCTQCYSCISVCKQESIQFIENEEGFKIPRIDRDKCVECGLCVKSCHILTPKREKSTPLHTYAGWCKDGAVRKKSSSGGAFSSIAHYVLNNNGIVYGASMGEDLQVNHIRIDDEKYLYKIRGSKYIQSNMEGVYNLVKQDLKDKKFVLFTGTPCQVAGLYSFLGNRTDGLLTVDLICHGVPSQSAFNTYLDKVGINKANSKQVGFRYLKGWGLQMWRVDMDGKLKNISPRNSFYLKAFLKGLMFSRACYNCRYCEPNRVGDLTIADFWEIGTTTPFYYSKQGGVSMLLTNTSLGQQVIDICTDFYRVERDLSEAIDGNPNLHVVSHEPKGRDNFYADLKLKDKNDIIEKYSLQPIWKEYLRPYKRILDEIIYTYIRKDRNDG